MGSLTSKANRNSQVASNTANKKEEKIKMLLARWVEQANVKLLPIELVEVIINFMPKWLSWSQSKHGKAVTFIDHNRIVIGHTWTKATLCFANEVISSELAEDDCFSWEIIYYRQEGISWPGFIGTEYDIEGKDFGKRVFDIGGSCLNIPPHCMNTGNYFRKEARLFICGDTQNGVVPFLNSVYLNAKQGRQRIGFRANFRERTMKLFIDGVNFGVIYTNIPKEFVICIGAANGKSDVEIVVNEKNFSKY